MCYPKLLELQNGSHLQFSIAARGLNQKTQTLSALVSMHADCVAAHYHGLRRKLVADLPAAVRRRALLVLLQGFQRSAAIDAARVMSAWENV
jgi:hypothetical protein